MYINFVKKSLFLLCNIIIIIKFILITKFSFKFNLFVNT
jgi:hypothetical protein